MWQHHFDWKQRLFAFSEMYYHTNAFCASGNGTLSENYKGPTSFIEEGGGFKEMRQFDFYHPLTTAP